MSLLRNTIRLKFRMTSRNSALRLIRKEADLTLSICGDLGNEACTLPVETPPLLGVDEDMRAWSLFQILEHNTIANRRITEQLLFGVGEGPEPDPDFDVKNDVMPGEAPGPEQIADFAESVEDHLRKVEGLGRLRNTRITNHPILGPFDAHMWNCMFGFHLQLHRKQADAAMQNLKAKANGDL